MPRAPRIDLTGYTYHCLNRASGRVQIFETEKDYQQFEQLLQEAKEMIGMQIHAYCIMPNHWHLALSPERDGKLAEFMKWITQTHTSKYHKLRGTYGSGHVYQGRYKSFPVQTNEYFLQLMKYIEQNPLRAKMVSKAEDWRWSSLWVREKGTTKQKELLEPWPIEMPKDYRIWVNEKEKEEDTDLVRTSIKRSRPMGHVDWMVDTAKKLQLTSTLRNQGGQRKN